MNPDNASTNPSPQQNSSDAARAPSSPSRDGVLPSKAFSIWTEDRSESQAANAAVPSRDPAMSEPPALRPASNGLPVSAQFMLFAGLCVAFWWAFTKEMRVSELNNDLAIAGKEMAALKAQSKDAAEQAEAKIQSLTEEIKVQAGSAAAEKQRLEASVATARKNAADMESLLRGELASLTRSKATLEGEVAKLRETIVAKESDVAELTRQKTTLEASLKDMDAQYGLVASQLSDVNVKAARLRVDLAELTQSNKGLQGEVTKHLETIAAKESKVVDLTKQKTATETALKDLTAQHETLGAQLNDLKAKAASLAEMIQVSEAARQTGAMEIARNRTRIEELQKQVEMGVQSIKMLAADKASLGAQVAEANRKMDEMAEARSKAAAEATRLSAALATSEKTLADIRTGLLQETDASRAELEAALARIEKLAASLGRTPATANKPNPQSPSGNQAPGTVGGAQQQAKSAQATP